MGLGDTTPGEPLVRETVVIRLGAQAETTKQTAAADTKVQPVRARGPHRRFKIAQAPHTQRL